MCAHVFENSALLNAGVMHDLTDAKGDLPIHTAVRNAKSTESAAAMMRLMTKHGHDVHARNEKTGETWSDLAALNDQIDAAKLRQIAKEDAQEN